MQGHHRRIAHGIGSSLCIGITVAASVAGSPAASIAALRLVPPEQAEGKYVQEPMEVAIDIKPGDEPTTVDPRRDGMLPVAILSSDTFDASVVVFESVRRVDPREKTASPAEGEEYESGAPPVRSAMEDVNGDGLVDRVLLFRNRDMRIECGDEVAVLRGTTTDGTTFEGREAIETVGCGQG